MKIVVGGNLGDKEIRCKSVATAIAVIRNSVSRNAYSFANVKVLLGKREGNGVAMRQGIAPFLHPWKGAFILSFCKKETKGIKKMKQTIKILAVALALIFSLMSFASCASEAEMPKTGDDGAATQAQGEKSLWDAADYTEDTEFGSGKKKVEVKVTAGEKSVTFTLNTDKENLADAMLEHSLVEGEDGQYGLYIKKVNGILADYDEDQTYWSISKGGEALMTGATDTKISDGERYEFTKAKG